MTWLLVSTTPLEVRIIPVPAARPWPPLRLVVMSTTPEVFDPLAFGDDEDPELPPDDPEGADGKSRLSVAVDDDEARCCHATPAAALPTNKATNAAAAGRARRMPPPPEGPVGVAGGGGGSSASPGHVTYSNAGGSMVAVGAAAGHGV